jgi:imidazolonepropionase-like amidohydrolase
MEMKLFPWMALTFAVCVGWSGTQQSSSVLILEHANVFTGSTSSPQLDVTLTIADGRIQKIQPSSRIHEAAPIIRKIDLRGAWVLPGLIDAHVHLYDIQSAQRMLFDGVTTGRSMLTTGYQDVGLKALYSRGDKDLPEILAAGFPVVAHPNTFIPNISSLFLDNPDLDDLRLLDRIGVDGARRIVDDNAKRHVNWIKVFANGRAGVLSAEPTSRDLNDEELQAAVKEATALGIPSAVHAYSDDGVSAAVRAGVRTVEHGSLITEPTIRLMKERGVCFTPTLSAFYAYANPGANASPEYKALAARVLIMIRGSHQAITVARKLGVTIIEGSDSGYGSEEDHTLIDEILRLADAGLSPAEAIDAATEKSAACLRIENQKGSVRPGLDADLVVYQGDPTKDLGVLRNPLIVITRGSIYLDRISKPSKPEQPE